MENLILTGLIAATFELDPRDWRTWMICWGVLGCVVRLC